MFEPDFDYDTYNTYNAYNTYNTYNAYSQDEKSHDYGRIMFVLKGLILVLLLGFIVYCLDSSTGRISVEKISALNSSLQDLEYTIPEQDRVPPFSPREYRVNRDKIATDIFMKSRLQFKEQYFVGSPLRDGFHAELPLNAMWKGGKVEMGEHVAALRRKEAEKTGVTSHVSHTSNTSHATQNTGNKENTGNSSTATTNSVNTASTLKN